MSSLFGSVPFFGTISRLCSACKNGDLATVKLLASKDNINTLGWLGWSPLHKAVQGGSVSVVEYILSNRELEAQVDVRDPEQHTALHQVAGVPNEEDHHLLILRALLDAGADVNAGDDGLYTPLHLAVLNNNPKIVSILIEFGCDVNLRNQDGYTALHVATRGGYQEIAKMLVQNGADVNLEDAQGRSPIQIAQKYANFGLEEWVPSGVINSSTESAGNQDLKPQQEKSKQKDKQKETQDNHQDKEKEADKDENDEKENTPDNTKNHEEQPSTDTKKDGNEDVDEHTEEAIAISNEIEKELQQQ